jgi:hypothetical protein
MRHIHYALAMLLTASALNAVAAADIQANSSSASAAPAQQPDDEEERRAQQLAVYEKAMAEQAAARKAAAEKAEADRIATEAAMEQAALKRAALKTALERAEAEKTAAAQAKRQREQAVANADVDRVLQRAKDDYPVLKTAEGEPLLSLILDRQKVLQARGVYPSVAMVEAVADHADALRPRQKVSAAGIQTVSSNTADQAKAFGGCRWVTPYVWSCK